MMSSAEFKVGLFVIACIVIIVVMSLKVNVDPSVSGRTQRYALLLPSANGIVKNSNVKMAGIPVGIIDDIVLDGAQARLDLKVQAGLKLTKSASAEIKPNGILGDKYVEINPGNPNDELLTEGSVIPKFTDSSGFDAVLNKVGKIAEDVGAMTAALKAATTGEGDDNSPLGRILHNVEDLTADLKDVSGDKKDKLESTIDHIDHITASLDEFINDDSDDGFKKNFKKMSKSLARVDDILKNVDEVSAKINHGEGTIGKLINDDTTVESLNHAIEGVNGFIDAGNKFQVSVDYNSEVMSNSMVKSYIGLNIQPGPDRYYSLHVVDDPKGSYYSGTTQQTVNGVPSTTTYQNVYQHQFKFSAEFAKNFYNLTVRAGVLESQGGVGLDYSFFNKRLRASVEAFNFSRNPEGPYLRAFVKYKLYSIFYAMAGGDDILNTKGNPLTGTGASGFIGAGLDFTNDDLKLLLTKVPF